MKKHLLLLATITVFLFSSCKEDPPVPKTKTQLLTQGSWKFSSATANGSDASAFLQACQKDNIYTFAAAGTGTVDEGATKCNAGDPQTIPFNWNFANNETIIHVSTQFFGTNDLTLVALTETELKVSFPYTPPLGPSIMIEARFIH